jgi:hypothetical protein
MWAGHLAGGEYFTEFGVFMPATLMKYWDET